MSKKTIKNIFTIFFVILIVAISSFTASAEVPYESYTYWSEVGEQDKSVYNRPMYSADFAIDASSLGIDDFKKINDITYDQKGNLYILDSESRIVVLDKNYKVVREIGLIGGKESYVDAKGVYIAKDNTVYICDTEGHRILHIKPNGSLINVITLPKSNLIPDDFEFRPTNMAIDDYGYTYILSDGSYYGALLYDTNMEFLGFYGANTVTATFGNVFSNIKNRLFPNNTKLGNSAKRLPYCFVDLALDKQGFIYTSTGYTDSDRKGQIKKLGPGLGNNILNSDEISFVDTKVNKSYNSGSVSKQDIFDIEVDDNGCVYGLESAFGKVFVYDPSCRILSVFGGGMGFGSQLGTFVTVSALAINNNGNEVLVADSATNKITVFKITEFGTKIKNLISLTLKGEYDTAKQGWEEVLTIDNNFQPAYGALARAYINDGDYDKALELAKKGYDRETYAIAFEYKRSEIINDNFILIFIVLFLVIALAIVFLVVSSRKKLQFIKNKQLNLYFSTIVHPSNVFTEIKEKKQGSILLCVISVLVFYVVSILQTLKGGFLFTIYDPSSFNSIWLFVKTAGLVVLWIVANWMVCTLLDGKGRFKEIAIVTCYSLLPLIIEKILRLVLTNVLLPTEASFLNILEVIAILAFLLLMVIGLLKIHDFNMGRLLGTSVLSIAGVAAIVFLAITIIILVQQFGGFFVTVVTEILTL
jgi:DNA-binding beta-propeller fold protein YncE